MFSKDWYLVSKCQEKSSGRLLNLSKKSFALNSIDWRCFWKKFHVYISSQWDLSLLIISLLVWLTAMVSKSFMSLDTSLLWSKEQLWQEALCSSENSECNNEHTCLQAMNRTMSVWLSSTVCCDIWPQSSGTGNLLNCGYSHQWVCSLWGRLNSSVSGLCFNHKDVFMYFFFCYYW